VPIVRDGWPYIIIPAILTVALFVLRWTWSGVALLIVTGLMANFFRDPERKVPSDPGLVVSPADGRVVRIADLPAGGALGVPSRQISIFLNVFDVHVNRTPIAGIIREVVYNKGTFLAAWDEKASLNNEQNRALVEADDGFKVAFTQIAGLIARRIVFTKKVGDRVERGERVGMIKFGSRTDIFLPADVTIDVKVGDYVRGGLSVIGRRRS
jgi:phosphatidylserine decarboxylase